MRPRVGIEVETNEPTVISLKTRYRASLWNQYFVAHQISRCGVKRPIQHERRGAVECKNSVAIGINFGEVSIRILRNVSLSTGQTDERCGIGILGVIDGVGSRSISAVGRAIRCKRVAELHANLRACLNLGWYLDELVCGGLFSSS